MIEKKLIGKLPVLLGEYDNTKVYSKKQRVTLYGSEFESIVDNNTTAPATLSNGTLTINTDNWRVVSNGTEAFLAGEKVKYLNEEDNSNSIFAEIDNTGKVLAYRDNDGIKHEEAGLKLNSTGLASFEKDLKDDGFISAVNDYSNDEFVEIPMPRICAKVNFEIDHLPTWDGDKQDGYIEFWDKDGNYFRKAITALDWQGDTSRSMPWKNYSFDIADGSKIKIGNWIPQDSFHLKKYYLDVFRGQCIVAYRLAEQMYQTRELGNRKPYQYLYSNSSIEKGNGSFYKDFFTGALTHPDGFPIRLYCKGEYKGIWVFALKKNRDNYAMKKDSQKNIILDGVLGSSQLWGGKIDWSAFEIRNPKVNKDINGNKYDGDNPTEPSSDFADLKSNITRLSNAIATINKQTTVEAKKAKFEEYFKIDELIDYFLFGNVTGDSDGFQKNWIWCTWDGNKWSPTYYDKDQIFGIVAWGENPHYTIGSETVLLGTDINIPSGLMYSLYKDEVIKEYKRLRDNGVFTTNNIIRLLEDWLKSVGYNNLKEEIEDICVDSNGIPQCPTYRPANDNDGNAITYSMYPHNGGFYNSVERVKNWIDARFKYLDSVNVFNYNV